MIDRWFWKKVRGVWRRRYKTYKFLMITASVGSALVQGS